MSPDRLSKARHAILVEKGYEEQVSNHAWNRTSVDSVVSTLVEQLGCEKEVSTQVLSMSAGGDVSTLVEKLGCEKEVSKQVLNRTSVLGAVSNLVEKRIPGKKQKMSGKDRRIKKHHKTDGAGFIKENRTGYRINYPLATQHERACLPVAVYYGLRRSGIEVSLDHVCSMYSTDGNTTFSVAQEYVKQFGLTLERVTKDFKVKGGEALAILKKRSGLYIVQLLLTFDNNDKFPDKHCVFYNGSELMDNQKYSKMIEIEERDRESSEAARAVFNAIAPTLKVQVSNVYQLIQ